MKKVSDLLEYTRVGLSCPHAGFSLDPSRKAAVAVVTHAHGDHALPNHDLIYTTRATRRLMQERYADKLRADFREVEFGHPFHLDDVKITFFPAGHILGSAQILMEHGGERYLYTGDFKVQHDPTCERYQPVACDYLITETTFAHPDFSHPPAHLPLKEFKEGSYPLVIGAYAVGKAQRITRLVHEHLPGRKVFVHPLVSGYHEVYQQEGVDLGDWLPYSRKEFLSDPSNILILPPSVFSRYQRHPGALRLFATGWKKSYYSCDRVLPISDHADWNDLLSTVESSGAHTVYTLHGSGQLLKEHFASSSSSSSKRIELLD